MSSVGALSTHSRRALVAAACALGIAAAVPVATTTSAGPAHAQSNQPSPHLNGTWALGEPMPQAQQTIEQAIAPVVRRLAPNRQPLARARLAESTWVPQQVVIQASATQISVQVVGQENRTFTSVPGRPQNVYSRSGVRASLTQQIRADGGLEQRLQALDGTQFNFYTPAADGRSLLLDVLIQSRQLSEEIRFRVPFRRR